MLAANAPFKGNTSSNRQAMKDRARRNMGAEYTARGEKQLALFPEGSSEPGSDRPDRRDSLYAGTNLSATPLLQ